MAEVKKRKVIRILSVDGGGIRGIIPATVLQMLERETGKPIHELFDVFAGTSTGSLLTSGVLLPGEKRKARYTAAEFLQFYNEDGRYFFQQSWWHKLKNLNGLIGPKFLVNDRDKILEKLYGSETRLSGLLGNALFPTYGLFSKQPIIFRTWQARESAIKDFYLVDILKGATAFPSIFPPHDIDNVNGNHHDVIMDAGLYMGSPTLQSLIAANILYPNQAYLIVSLGTGEHAPMFTPYTAQIKCKKWGLAQWSVDLFVLSMNALGKQVDAQARALHQLAKGPLSYYYRFDVAIDNRYVNPFSGSLSHIKALNDYGKVLVEQQQDRFNEVINLLTRDIYI